MKIVFDIIFSIAGIILSLPLWIFFGLLIWAQDRDKVFYVQDRVGKNGRIFKSIQFRSMVPEAEKYVGAIQSLENDKRVTGVGSFMRQTAIDEIPQLINILKGDMSFVGPRALRPEEKEVGSDKVVSVFDYPDFKERSSVTPGLTGVAQILLSRDAPREQKFAYDIWYIKHQNLWLDIYLIFLSFLVSFRGKWGSRKDKLVWLLEVFKLRIEK